MAELNKIPYELSVWQDVIPANTETTSGIDLPYFEEEKVAVIGGSNIDSPVRAYDVTIKEQVNGASTLTFNMIRKYWNNGELVDNPLIPLLVSEAKVKLRLGEPYNLIENDAYSPALAAKEDTEEKWQDFIVKRVDIDKNSYVSNYTCEAAFPNELGRNGWSVLLDTELENNYGTLGELTEKVLENTDILVSGDVNPTEHVLEQLFSYRTSADISAILTKGALTVTTIPAGSIIYFFYKNVTPSNGNWTANQGEQQILYRETPFGIDDVDDDYAVIDFSDEYQYDITLNSPVTVYLVGSDSDPAQTGYALQGRRIVKSISSHFETVADRYVYDYIADDAATGVEPGTKVYSYYETDYLTSDSVMNYIANASGATTDTAWKKGNNDYTVTDIRTFPMASAPATPEGWDDWNPHPINYLVINQGLCWNEGLRANKVRLVKDNTYVIRLKARRILQNAKDYGASAAEVISTNTSGSSNLDLKFDVGTVSFDNQGNPTVTSYINGAFPVEFTSYTTLSTDEDRDKYGFPNPVANRSDRQDVAALNYKQWANDEEGYCYAYVKATQDTELLSTKLAFIITSDSNDSYQWNIQDVQFFEYKEWRISQNRTSVLVPIFPGDIPEAIADVKQHFYIVTDNEEIQELSNDTSYYTPIMRDNYAAVRSINVAESTYLNTISSLAELFEVWVRFKQYHTKDGHLLIENNVPKREIIYSTYAPFDEYNWAGFKYKQNLQNIKRNTVSDSISTKMIVKNNNNEFATDGMCSITRAQDNPSGENVLYNFDYYVNMGMLSSIQVASDLYGLTDTNLGYYAKMRAINDALIPLNERIVAAQGALYQAEEMRNYYQISLDSAASELSAYKEEYKQKEGTIDPDDVELVLDQINLMQAAVTKYQEKVEEYDNQVTAYHDLLYGSDTATYKGNWTTAEEYKTGDIVYDEKSKAYYKKITDENYVITYLQPSEGGGWTYISGSITWDSVQLMLWMRRNAPTAHFEGAWNPTRVYTTTPPSVVRARMSSSSPGMGAFIKTAEYDITLEDCYPSSTNPDMSAYWVPYGFVASDLGLINQQQVLTDHKRQLNLTLYRKYYRYIQEGTWNDDQYMDDNLYYLDANKILNQSSYPQLTYTIDVVDIEGVEQYAAYAFKIGQRTYVEDTDFFGWKYVTIGSNTVKTPFRKEVIVSERARNLDDESKSVLKIQTYQGQWDDLFSQLTASAQSLQYSSGAYQRAANAITPSGAIQMQSLEQSFANNAFLIANSKNQNVVWDSGTGIEVSDATNPLTKVRITSNGIAMTTDGGASWINGITGQGINTNYLLAGQIDASKINILGGENQYTFSWNADGLNAILAGSQGESYVRFNDYGIFGTTNGISIDEYLDNDTYTDEQKINYIKQNSTFYLGWDGIVLRSQTLDGNVITLNPDIGLEVFNADQAVDNPWKWTNAKIAATTFNKDGAGNNYEDADPIPVITVGEFYDGTAAENHYGLLLRNSEGKPTLYTSELGALNLTGTLKLYKNGDVTSPSYIILDGPTGKIGHSTNSWFIDSDGYAEFQNAKIRGTLSTSVFEKEKVSMIGGDLVISPTFYIEEEIKEDIEGGWDVSNLGFDNYYKEFSEEEDDPNQVIFYIADSEENNEFDGQYYFGTITREGEEGSYMYFLDNSSLTSADAQNINRLYSININSTEYHGALTQGSNIVLANLNTNVIRLTANQQQGGSILVKGSGHESQLGYIYFDSINTDIQRAAHGQYGLYSDNAFIEGTVYATSGEFSAAISGASINAKSLTTDGINFNQTGDDYYLVATNNYDRGVLTSSNLWISANRIYSDQILIDNENGVPSDILSRFIDLSDEIETNNTNVQAQITNINELLNRYFNYETNTITIDNGVYKNLKIGNFKFVPQTNGNLRLEKVN